MSEKMESLARTIRESHANEAHREAEAANEKLDKLAALFIQIGFAIAGLAGIRLPGHTIAQFPNTYLGIFLIALSVFFGAWQIFKDADFFTINAFAARLIAGAGLGVELDPTNSEKVSALKKALDDRAEMSTESCDLALFFQASLLLLSFVLIIKELPITVN